MPVIPALGKLRREDQEFKASLVLHMRLCIKKTNKRVRSVAQVEECLSSKCKALGLNPTTTKTNKQILNNYCSHHKACLPCSIRNAGMSNGSLGYKLNLRIVA
jgi:hypothetical protein